MKILKLGMIIALIIMFCSLVSAEKCINVDSNTSINDSHVCCEGVIYGGNCCVNDDCKGTGDCIKQLNNSKKCVRMNRGDCLPVWECDEWQECSINNTQIRECHLRAELSYDCGQFISEEREPYFFPQPIKVQNCTYIEKVVEEISEKELFEEKIERGSIDITGEVVSYRMNTKLIIPGIIIISLLVAGFFIVRNKKLRE